MPRITLALVAMISLVSTARADVDDPMYACNALPASAKISVNVKPETSVADLAIWVTGFTCKNVVFSADVAKRATKVTVVSSKPMSPAQAVKLFVDAVEATGLVVVQKPDTFVIKLGPGMPKACPDVALEADTAPRRIAPPAPPAAPAISDADLDAGVKAIDATHATITRALIERVLADPMTLGGGARLVPSIANGTPNGFKLYAIRPKSLFARVGLVNGDTVRRINNRELTSPDKALEVYASLRDATELVVDLTRAGKPMALTIAIR